MADLDQLKTKYHSVIELAKEHGVHLTHVHIQDDKLFIQGAAPNENVKNAVWNEIKRVDASYSDLTADITIDSSLPQPAVAQADGASSARSYTVVSGDSLSKIAKHFYGDGNQYMKIFHANEDQLDDPNKIQIGQVLVIPE